MSLRRALIASLMACHLAACQPAQRSEAGQDRSDGQAPVAPALPVREPPIDRRALLLALTEAASAAGLGEDDRERQRALDGKRFELRLRFGCGGPGAAAPAESRRWTFDEESRVLRIHVEPELGLATPLVRSVAPAGFEAVQGFWIGRPWLLGAGCPATPHVSAPEPTGSTRPMGEKPASQPAQPEPRMAIAQFYTAIDPRTHRRNSRAYQTTKTLAADEGPSPTGYELVLSGRLRALPNGRVIACMATDAEAAPACIIAAAFDHVAIEVPDSGEIVAQWAMG